LPEEYARPIGEAHAAVFAELGYRCDPDPELESDQANGYWMQLHGPVLLEKQRKMLKEANERLAQFGELGPIAFDVARKLRRLSITYPSISSLVKRILSPLAVPSKK
jgi:hypothetical protein